MKAQQAKAGERRGVSPLVTVYHQRAHAAPLAWFFARRCFR
jgi:hypothetical protein